MRYIVSMSDVQDKTFNMRVPADLSAAFLAACERNDMSAAQVVRAFMRDYVRANAQPELMPAKPAKRPQ